MHRRRFLGMSAFCGGSLIAMASHPLIASARQVEDSKPIRIILAGYSPRSSSFSRGLTLIGDRLIAKFPDEVEVHYVHNILDLGYEAAGDLTWMVESGVLTLAYLTMFAGVPALQLAAVPFLFADSTVARTAMDGMLGASAIETIEANTELRVLGFFENGFRHVSNSVRPVHSPADLHGLTIRVLGVQARTFELFGANAEVTPLPAVFQGLQSGTLHGQENPFENVVTYGLYRAQRYYTETFHSYLSRPIFVHKASFDAWPEALQTEMRAAVEDSVSLQRQLHDVAEIEAAATIQEAGGEIVSLSNEERAAFVAAVKPIYADARQNYSRELLDAVGL